jgi:hypothetical protein
MSRAVIVVRTANRPEILNRCIETAGESCCVARESLWLILDDSCPEECARNREITRHWKRRGLRLAFVDRAVEGEIADSLPDVRFRNSFTQLAARSPACPSEGGRNLALLTGLSLDPDILFFADDDMVIRHGENCFFHWCLSAERADSFVASPRKRGIGDMTYLNRLLAVLTQDEWAQFVSDAGISADPGRWYSPANPLWKRKDVAGEPSAITTNHREVVNGQLMALRAKGTEWLPFPAEYNSDLNWSLMQSALQGTALLKARGVHAEHLPPCIGHPNAEAIMSELVGPAITRALRQIKPRGEHVMTTLAARVPEALRTELKRELLLFMAVEQAIESRLRTCTSDAAAGRTLSEIKDTLADVAERLKSVDSRQLADEWLSDFADRQRMFLSLRRNETVQSRIRQMLFDLSA